MIREQVSVGALELTIESGAIARQASGAVVVSCGETVLLATISAAKKASSLPFMPLTVEYRQRMAAAGLIPGSYARREAKPTDLEILTSRMVDRSIRPFFPDTWRCETQVLLHPLSYDPATDMHVLAITAASAALNVSNLPWKEGLVGVRIALVEGELVAFPTGAQRAESDLDLLVSVTPDGIVMLEGGAEEASEEQVLAAFGLAQEAAKPLQGLLERVRAAAPPLREAEPVPSDPELEARVRELGEAALREALQVEGKHARYAALDAASQQVLDALRPAEGEDPPALARDCLDALKKSLIRAGIQAGERLGGRGPADVRAITGRAGWLPRSHGSSLFTRGETQCIATCTLGGGRDAQLIETLDGSIKHRFLLHYNFPSYCVGEARPIRGPGRREIGHGHLARRALLPVLPADDDWPYVTRIDATVTESNGSSSMATVCAASLALLDAGVPIKSPVAGVAMGLVKEGEEVVVLTDILGDEDHVGDMDFKVAGTSRGITAIQLDNKLGSVPLEVMRRALEQARAGRLHILARMADILPEARGTLSPYARRVAAVRIEPNRIRDLIGPGGSTIKGLRAATGVDVDVEDDGLVKLFGPSDEAIAQARVQVADLTGLPVLGQDYSGRVVAVKHFGAFVRLFQGIEGLLRSDGLSVGSEIRVRVAGVTDDGKLELQRA